MTRAPTQLPRMTVDGSSFPLCQALWVRIRHRGRRYEFARLWDKTPLELFRLDWWTGSRHRRPCAIGVRCFCRKGLPGLLYMDNKHSTGGATDKRSNEEAEGNLPWPAWAGALLDSAWFRIQGLPTPAQELVEVRGQFKRIVLFTRSAQTSKLKLQAKVVSP